MSIATIVTLGYGSFGSVSKLPTLGYSVGAAVQQTYSGGIDAAQRGFGLDAKPRGFGLDAAQRGFGLNVGRRR